MTPPKVATALPFAPVIARPLPHTVTPFPNETLNSYFNRLASANKTTTQSLRTPSRWLRCTLNDLELLEILSGQPRTSLVWALPELRQYAPGIAPPPQSKSHSTRFACRRCIWQAGGTEEVQVLVRTPYDQVCIRHRLWLSDGVGFIGEQVDLTPVPEVVRAQILLNRLEKRHGAPFTIECYKQCYKLWNQLDRRALVRHEADALLHRLCEVNDLESPLAGGRAPIRFARFHPFRLAARHPQIAKFTALASSPSLHALARSSPEEAEQRITDAFEEVFPLDYRPRSITGPWMREALVSLITRMYARAKLLQLSEMSELPPSLLP